MDFGRTAEEIAFRTRVRDVLARPEVRKLTERIAADGENNPAERDLYRLLGQAGILGVAWPTEYGGAGITLYHAAVVGEELALAGIPDAPYVNGIQTVGQLLLTAGTAEQRSRFLPRLADGSLLASVLYTEPEAGSDLASLSCSAVRSDQEFELTGTKVFALKCGIADIALCAARTAPPTESKYHGITLFLVELGAPGVDVFAMESVPDERFHIVTLDRVRVKPDVVVGALDQGWLALVEALPLERVGFDFAARAARWFGAGRAGPDAGSWSAHTARYAARVEAARLLSVRAATEVSEGRGDTIRTSVAKWYASQLAAELAGWALQRHAPEPPLEIMRAYREAPGLELSGGTSEMMLRTMVQQLPDVVDGFD